MTVISFQYREKCFNHKDRVCVVCGATSNICVHHKNGDREDDSLENLIPVCRECHYQIHYKGADVSDDLILEYRKYLPEKSFMDGRPPEPKQITSDMDWIEVGLNLYEYQIEWFDVENKHRAVVLRDVIDECRTEGYTVGDSWDGIPKNSIHVNVTPEQRKWILNLDEPFSAIVREKLDERIDD